MILFPVVVLGLCNSNLLSASLDIVLVIDICEVLKSMSATFNANNSPILMPE